MQYIVQQCKRNKYMHKISTAFLKINNGYVTKL